MKKLFLSLAIVSLALLGACADQKPLTEKEQAAEYNMTMEEYQETKEAAARMNMTIKDHMKITQSGEMDMDMSDM